MDTHLCCPSDPRMMVLERVTTQCVITLCNRLEPHENHRERAAEVTCPHCLAIIETVRRSLEVTP